MTFTNTLKGRLLSLSLISMILTSCGTDHKITFDVGSSYNFGSVDITKKTEKTFTLTNASDEKIYLADISEQGLGLSGDFYHIGGTCETGLGLAKKATCTLVIGYKPTSLGLNTQVVKVKYLEKDKKKSHTGKLTLSGRGEVDCSLAQNLTAKYNSGKSDASTKNTNETARGKADGEALTYQDGAKEGKTEGYSVGYNSGYYSPQGFDLGYDDGYDQGYYSGKNSYYACSSGSSDGSSDGAADGKNDGDYDGYNEGYNYGLSEGYYANTCSEGDYSEPPTPDLGSTEFETACYEKGYVEVLNPNAYKVAYAAAKAANIEYNTGYDVAYTEWYYAGEVAGISQGYSDGKSEGYDIGREYGEAVAYDNCYADAYEQSYQYNYAVYFSSGWDDGYDDGYYDGYYEAQDECDAYYEDDYSLANSSSQSVKQYGQGKDWAEIQADGSVLSKHVYADFSNKKALKFIPEEERFKLLFDIANFRASTSSSISKEKIRAKLSK